MSLRRFVWVLVLMCGAGMAGAKDHRFYGQLVNKDNQGLPNSFVSVKGLNQSFPCDNKGRFSFSANVNADDSLVFFASGYERAAIVIDVLPDDSIIVELKKNSTVLQEFTLGLKSGRVREEVAGSKKGNHQAGCYLLFKDEIALFLPADSSLHGLVKDVNVYITKDGKAISNKFFIHLYRPDSTGAPGEEVTDTELIVNARRGNEWVSADVSGRKIQAGSGLFVSVEWAYGMGNDGFPYNIPPGTSNYYSGNDSLRNFYNGQVLGLTWVNNPKPIVYRRYARTTYEKTAPDKWFLTPPTNGGRKRNECITPMMYFTYSYVEH